MKQYTIKICKNLIENLEEAKDYVTNVTRGTISYTLPETLPASHYEDFEISVEADSDNSLFMFGYWVERFRDQGQAEHYDLKDNKELSVKVPAGFIGICNTLDLKPEGILELYAGDLCKHPFITGGSDERDQAEQYFHRHFIYGCDEKTQEKMEIIFGELQSLREEWGGNDKMKEYKKHYPKRIKQIFK